MSIRTTVTLDEDVIERIKQESRSRGLPFRTTLNELLRTALVEGQNKPLKRALKIRPTHMGGKEGLNYDNVEALLAFAEGERHL